MGFDITFLFYLSIQFIIGVMIKQSTPVETLIEIWDGSNSWQISYKSSRSEYGTWKQFTITWNHTCLKIFVNGFRKARSCAKFPMTTFLDKSVKANQLAIGTHSKVGSRLSQMEMHFDDLMIWQSYLDDKQVMSQYAAGEDTTRANLCNRKIHLR